MKKIIFLLASLLLPLKADDSAFTTAFSAGFVFKQDHDFREVYGPGIANLITADGCYYPWQCYGIGTKLSYWRITGHTTFLRQRSVVQEVPITFYLRRKHDLSCGFQLYGSLGGGIIWVNEKNYLDDVKMSKGILEAEVGLNYNIWNYIDFTTAFRYLFPRISAGDKKIDVGGCELRAGIQFSF